MGIEEHTQYSVRCDVCGARMEMGGGGYVCVFATGKNASAAARKAGWTDDRRRL